MKIIGHTVGATNPRPDWEQTDPKKADYIKNKPDLDDRENKLKTEIMKEVGKKASTNSYVGTLTAAGWSGSAPYIQTITVPGLLATDNPFVDVNLSGVTNGSSILEAWILAGRVTVTADNTVVAYCYEDKPEVDIPILFKVVR